MTVATLTPAEEAERAEFARQYEERILATRMALGGKDASFVWGRPYHETIAVSRGEACWLSSRPVVAPCCGPESAPCQGCRAFEPAETSLVGEVSGPVCLLVPCPRCSGLGIRQFDSGETETCSSCEGSGLVDSEVARTIERLMEEADRQADPDGWGTSGAVEHTLPELVAIEARHYRSLGSEFGVLLAETLERLGTVVDALDAKDVATYRDRRHAMLAGL